jgi:hypothetical protein
MVEGKPKESREKAAGGMITDMPLRRGILQRRGGVEEFGKVGQMHEGEGWQYIVAQSWLGTYRQVALRRRQR